MVVVNILSYYIVYIIFIMLNPKIKLLILNACFVKG